MRGFLAIVVLSAFFILPARATTFATDATDLWWVGESESGWGANVVQQDDTLFITFFVYDANRAPIWYSGGATYVTTSSSGLIYSGGLYQTSGPWFGAPWNASQRTDRQVGPVTFVLTGIASATLNYSVDGVNVTKQLTRQTWRANDLSGSYLGGMIGTFGNCPSGNGYGENAGVLVITHSAATVTMAANITGGTCTFSGTYKQEGRMGSFDGPFTCTNGNSGTFRAFEIEAGISGLTGRASTQFNGSSCAWVGRFGGVRKSQ